MSGELITVASYWDVREAHLARIRLKQHGITAFLQEENVAGLVYLANATGGTQLQVQEDDVQRAKELLDSD